MIINFNDSQFFKDLSNISLYAEGFLEGIKAGEPEFKKNIATDTIDMLKKFIDSNARIDPQSLHHVYEWYQTGQETGRLFDITYTIDNGGISINSSFRQSQSVSNGSNIPFYDKATIMENGIPVTIRPKYSKVLAFDDNGEQVFTSKEVHIDRPGGTSVQGSYERVFNMFFDTYFSQAFLTSSGLSNYLSNPKAFKENINSGKRGGRSVGKQTGYNWIVKAGGAL